MAKRMVCYGWILADESASSVLCLSEYDEFGGFMLKTDTMPHYRKPTKEQCLYESPTGYPPKRIRITVEEV